jgi:hypothetical protein
MKIVRPGVAREAPDDTGATVLGRCVSVLIVAGWGLTALCSQLQGAQPGRTAWLLAAIGVISGVTWATRRFDAEQMPLRALLAAASLQSIAAALAFDRGVIAAWPFALLLAIAAGQVARTRNQLAAHAALLAAGQVGAAAYAPDPAPHAAAAVLVLAASIVLLAIASSGVRELRLARGAARVDVDALHARLRAVVHADPERFALLAMDEGFSIVASHAAGETDPAAALQRSIDEAMTEYRRAEAADDNAAIGVAVYPDDGRTADELLASAAAALSERRAAAEPHPVTH